MTTVDKLANLLEFAKTGEDFWIKYTSGKQAIVHFDSNGQFYMMNEKNVFERSLLVLGYVTEVQQVVSPSVVTTVPTTWLSKLIARVARKESKHVDHT